MYIGGDFKPWQALGPGAAAGKCRASRRRNAGLEFGNDPLDGGRTDWRQTPFAPSVLTLNLERNQ